jgi:hypothetical protein
MFLISIFKSFNFKANIGWKKEDEQRWMKLTQIKTNKI